MKNFVFFLVLLDSYFSIKAIKTINQNFLQLKNPDQPAGGSGGGNSGEFNRRDQVQEHVIIPLINTLEAEYIFAPNIKEYRQNFVAQSQAGMNRLNKINTRLNTQFSNILGYSVNSPIGYAAKLRKEKSRKCS